MGGEQITKKTSGVAGLGVIVAGLIAAGVYTVRGILGPSLYRGDYSWSLVEGRWILAHHAVMYHDHFSYALGGRAITSTEWGYDVLVALLAKMSWGPDTMLIIGWLGSLALGAWWLRRIGASWGRLAGFSVLWCVVAVPLISQGRALTLSLLYFPLLLLLLHRARTKPRVLWWLIPLFVLWVNTHGTVLLGLAVVGVELVLALLPIRAAPGLLDRSTQRVALSWGLFGAVVGSCISPWGPGLLLYDFHLSTNGQITNFIAEWQAPDFHFVLWMVLLAAVLGVLAREVRSGSTRAFEMCLCVALLVGWLHSVRLVPYFFLALYGLYVSRETEFVRKEWARKFGVVVSILVIGLVASLTTSGAFFTRTPQIGLPTKAYAWLSEHRVTSRVLVYFNWASYALVEGRSSFVDGRADLFTGKVLTQYLHLVGGTGHPEAILNEYKVSYVMWPAGSPLGKELTESGKWALEYKNSGVVIYGRTGVNPWSSINGLLAKN